MLNIFVAWSASNMRNKNFQNIFAAVSWSLEPNIS